MSEPAFSVGMATSADIDGILAVQEENQPEFGGSLSVRMPRRASDSAQ